MKRSTKLVTAIALTFGIAGGAIAYGKHNFGNPEMRAKHVVSYVAEELELDASQSEKLSALKDQMLEKGQLMREQFKPMHQNLSDLIEAEQFDQDKALQMLSQKTELVNQQAPEMIAALGEFIDSLNAEQKAEVMEFIKHKKEHRGRHFQ